MHKIIVANWKMNGSLEMVDHQISRLLSALDLEEDTNSFLDTFIICPPFPYLYKAYEKCHKSCIKIGAQNCSGNKIGPFTGEVSASMLRDIGCDYVILGHSERRVQHNEDSHSIARKIQIAQAEGLVTILCIGETLEEKLQGKTTRTLEDQLTQSLPSNLDLSKLIIAYEPIWAIGTGRTPLPDEANGIQKDIHTLLREKFSNSAFIPILYGGSVTSDNAKDIMTQPHINGVLIGGASLKVDEIIKILNDRQPK